MTVKPVNVSLDCVAESRKPKDFSSPECGDLAGKVSRDDRRVEETERSPKAVGKWGKYVHSQILRIREEDSHLGEEFSLGIKENVHLSHHHHYDHVDLPDPAVFSKPILPSSPLSRKTSAVEALL